MIEMNSLNATEMAQVCEADGRQIEISIDGNLFHGDNRIIIDENSVIKIENKPRGLVRALRSIPNLIKRFLY